ncbi:hypothetical protein HYH43_13920 [Clostridium botulinum]|uniref:hypothetical protein n=1 Tax=Clostridium botulinum TaxID=1491 RepID=UPI001C9B54EC|nr:hypothetical protein [Clostridium botulinum]MBY6790531.1 hypothetical protein [Clostridium botulinum]NFG76255.1 hypothetical protein [Clostridium botulinum]
MSNYWKISYGRKSKNSYFTKEKYSFSYSEKKINSFQPYLFEFNVTVDENIDIVSILNFLKSPMGTLVLLDNIPSKTTDLIEKYDNNIENIYLFHDIKSQYIIFAVPEQLKYQKDGIAFIGITTLDKKIRFFIKTFNFNIINDIHETLVECLKENISIIDINYINNIKWLTVNKYMVLKKDITRCKLENTILKDSINCNYEKMYYKLFELFVKKGYITFYERKEISELRKSNGAKIRNILKRYLKLPVEEGRATLIQDEIANDAKDDDKNSVYTLSASGWKYFMNNWFEDYVGQALKNLNNINIEYMQPESEFNFKQSNQPDDKMEIDWLILANKNKVSKVICIECKRTMTDKRLKEIREKYEEKLIKTNNYNVIDGFINIGFFASKKDLKNYEHNTIKVDKISIENNIEKLFLTFVSDSFYECCENLEKAILHIFEEN